MKLDKIFKNIFVVLFVFIISGVVPTVLTAEVVNISILSTQETSTANETWFKSAFKDGDFIYFVSDLTPSVINKYNASDLSYVSSLALDNTENYPYVAAAHGGYAYIGLYDNQARIVKVDLGTFSKVETLNPDEGAQGYVGVTIDRVNNIGYFTTTGSPSKVVKVDLETFSVTSILTLDEGDGPAYVSGVIDHENNVLYTALYTAPARIVKINLADFTRESAVTLESGENYAYALTYNPSTQTLYTGILTNPGKVVSIDTSTMTQESSVVLEGEAIASNSLWYDSEFNKLYVIGGTSNPVFSMFDVSTMTVEDSFEVATEGFIDSTIYDTENRIVYFGSYRNPGQITKIQLYNETVEPAPEPEPTPAPTPSTSAKSQFTSARRSEVISSIVTPSVTTIQQAVFALINQNRELLISAHSLGIALPSFVLETLGLPVNISSALQVRNLSLGMTGDDVQMLQKVLNAQGFQITNSGAGSPGNESKTFGPLTRQALVRYQQDKGISPANGFFGPVTRAQMKAAGIAGLWW